MISDPKRLSLITRTLRIEESHWRLFENEFAARFPDRSGTLDQRISMLKQVWRSISPHEDILAESFEHERLCPVCSAEAVSPVTARRQNFAPSLVYGACESCGLGILLQGASDGGIYSDGNYYEQQDSGGAGYHNYLEDRSYRESKGLRIVEWIKQRARRPLRTFLEIGSGFGFTRAAAESLELITAGIDINPHAAKIAKENYGHHTFTGTLESAIGTDSIAKESYDTVCYQFLIEHLEDPAAELRFANQTVSPNGVLALVVPNMQAREREIFGASYRSYRSDHLWLFSVESLKLLLDQAGFRMLEIESECSIRLLRGFLTEPELDQLDAKCESADLLVLAERK